MDALTKEVLERFEGSQSARFREVMQSLVRHLHAFARDVELTEEEWFAAMDFLTRCGHITDDKRQEFILLSDVMGLSMQVVGLNNRKPEEATEATVFGPFFVEDSPKFSLGDDISNGAPGEPCYFSGRILSTDGTPVPNAHIEVWQSDEDGFYDVQYDDLDEMRGRGQMNADGEGRYRFWSVKPVAYPIPYDGPVGDMLKAANRSPMRPAHEHFMISADGYETLITHVFDREDEYLETDAVFGVKESLVTTFERHAPGEAPDGRTMERPFHTITYDFVMNPKDG
jgi:hydroxyquinol 1,2-dioxygenase